MGFFSGLLYDRVPLIRNAEFIKADIPIKPNTPLLRNNFDLDILMIKDNPVTHWVTLFEVYIDSLAPLFRGVKKITSPDDLSLKSMGLINDGCTYRALIEFVYIPEY